jgi:hypothetical protein
LFAWLQTAAIASRATGLALFATMKSASSPSAAGSWNDAAPLSNVRTHSLAADSSASFAFFGSTGFASAERRAFIASGESAVSSAATAVIDPLAVLLLEGGPSGLSRSDLRSCGRSARSATATSDVLMVVPHNGSP